MSEEEDSLSVSDACILPAQSRSADIPKLAGSVPLPASRPGPSRSIGSSQRGPQEQAAVTPKKRSLFGVLKRKRRRRRRSSSGLR